MVVGVENRSLTRRWHFSAPILLICLALCTGIIIAVPGFERNHTAIPLSKAIELLEDAHMREGAMFSIDNSVRLAIAALSKRADAGDLEAAATLLHWHQLLEKR